MICKFISWVFWKVKRLKNLRETSSSVLKSITSPVRKTLAVFFIVYVVFCCDKGRHPEVVSNEITDKKKEYYNQKVKVRDSRLQAFTRSASSKIESNQVFSVYNALSLRLFNNKLAFKKTVFLIKL